MIEQAERQFTAAFETADCEALIGVIGEWFNKPYRNPTNALDIAPCVHSAMTAEFTKREQTARARWNHAEADQWKAARQSFDAGMRRFVETLGIMPNPEPKHDEQTGKAAPWADPNKWGNSATRPEIVNEFKPAIGAGWSTPPKSAALK